MKKFRTPKISVVHLSKEIITQASLCEANMCEGFDCYDCPTICTGVYHCNLFKCTTYVKPE